MFSDILCINYTCYKASIEKKMAITHTIRLEVIQMWNFFSH